MDLLAEFENKKILVTGAGRGIGREVVITLAKAKARVYALSKTEAHLITLVNEFPEYVIPIVCDLTNWEETEKALHNIEPLDCLVNNAGLASRDDIFNFDPDAFDKTMTVNVKAVINVTKHVAKKMIEAGKQGSIVNVSSAAAVRQRVGLMTYCASKAALDMLTKCMAVELGPSKIRVNSVNPTIVLTDMGKALWATDNKIELVLKKIPLGHLAETSHCINAIVFLLSSMSGMTTGEFLLLDGGYTAT